MKEIKQSCPHGLTEDDLAELLGESGLPDFHHWMRGQTVMLCEGRAYDHDRRENVPDACAESPHGMVTYRWDVERYLRGLPVTD